MRILVLTNLYPEHYIGGYELACRDVVEGLRRRGHELLVLTSRYGVAKPKREKGVWRVLQGDCLYPRREPFHWRMWLVRKEVTNLWALKRSARLFRPDIVYVWNYFNISVCNLFWLQRRGLPLLYFAFDNWLAHWESDPWYAAWYGEKRSGWLRGAQVLGRPFFRFFGLVPPKKATLDLSSVQFGSEYLKRYALAVGKPVKDGEVLHWGVDLNLFSFNEKPPVPHRLLYAGQLVRHKGVHTAVEAMEHILRHPEGKNVSLTVAGEAVDQEYGAWLRQMAEGPSLRGRVSFLGKIPRGNLAQVYAEHDIFVSTSIWDEPLSIAILEAMASGLAVVGTATGGAAEILQDGVNGLVFLKDNPVDCAEKILQLVTNPLLFHRLRTVGRQMVEERFSLERLLERIERSLEGVVAARGRRKSGAAPSGGG